MPLPSREVITLRLIFECEEEDIENEVCENNQEPSLLLRLPVELRLKVLRYLLRIDRNRKAHTRRPAPTTISELLFLNPRRILEAAPFKHKGGQEIDGSPPVINTCPLHPAILMTCKRLYWEGKTILYAENKVVGLQSGIRGLGAKLKNYGIPVWGPLPSTRLINAPGNEPQVALSSFDPVMLFTGQNTKPNTPLYICSYKDSADFMHALWIMIKCPFARGMRYNLSLSAEPRYRHVNRTDSFVKFAVLPWLHNHINSISFHCHSPALRLEEKENTRTKTADTRLKSIREELSKHVAASNSEPNLHTYRAVCSYLEQVLLQGEICIEQMNFLSAELLFERVCYEASSIVRTRTSKLVDVSAKSKDGINRVCKLIAVSAFRLCELRSGSLAQLYSRGTRLTSREAKIGREMTTRQTGKEPTALNAEVRDVSEDRSSSPIISRSPARITDENKHRIDEVSVIDPSSTNVVTPITSVRPTQHCLPRTTRLDQQLARDLAITSGLLALRLPCASPVPEWNIRLDIMLLRLFAEREDMPNAVWSIRRIQSNCHIELKEMKAKNKSGEKCQMLNTLMSDLAKELRPGAPRSCFFETANKCQKVVTTLWGERLIPKKGFNGLIWTFRWAG